MTPSRAATTRVRRQALSEPEPVAQGLEAVGDLGLVALRSP